MSPDQKTRSQYSRAETVLHSQIATYLVRQARRSIRKAGNRQPSPSGVAQ